MRIQGHLLRSLALLVLLGALGVWWVVESLPDPRLMAMLVATCALVGAARVVAAFGWGELLGMWRALAVEGEPDRRSCAALATMIRGVVGAGLTLGLLAVILLFLSFRLPDPERSPAVIAGLARWSLIAPLTGLFLGRVMLGGLLDAIDPGATANDPESQLAICAIPVLTFLACAAPV